MEAVETQAPVAVQVDERGVLGEVGRKIDPSNIVFDAADCAGFKAVLRMGRSDKNKGHRAWGTKLFGDSFGTTQNGGLVLYVNGALVPIVSRHDTTATGLHSSQDAIDIIATGRGRNALEAWVRVRREEITLAEG